jgi:heme/copper-type cytochrome/quinol oxidase subunit 2
MIERQKMTTAQILSAQIPPHSAHCVAVVSLVAIFLIVEIALVCSIFRSSSKHEEGKESQK